MAIAGVLYSATIVMIVMDENPSWPFRFDRIQMVRSLGVWVLPLGLIGLSLFIAGRIRRKQN